MQATFGYTIFYVSDVAAGLTFYTKAFGITRRFLTPEGDYGELETGATVLAFASRTLAERNLAASGGFVPISREAAPPGATVTLVVDDVTAAVTAAVGNGADLYTAPTTKPWGQTVGYVRDPNGVLVEIATPMGT